MGRIVSCPTPSHLVENPYEKQKQENPQTQLTEERYNGRWSSRLIDNLWRQHSGRLGFIVIARNCVELVCQSQQGLIHTMSGLIGVFDSAVDVRQFRSSKCRQAQPYRVVHINVIGFNNDQKNETVVFAVACWQAKLHVT